jgi:hypothetical protein
MQNHTSKPPKMGNTPRYIVETPNQLWGAYSWENTYPVTLQDGSSRHAKLHVFDDLAIAKQVLVFLRNERGGAKLRIYQLAGDGKRVEVQP